MSGNIGFSGEYQAPTVTVGVGDSEGSYSPDGWIGATSGGGTLPEVKAYNQYVMDNYKTISHISSTYDATFFQNNPNASNPYEQSVTIDGRYLTDTGLRNLYISGNRVEIASSYQRYNPVSKENFTEYIYRIYNNAYVEFENAAMSTQITAAQQASDTYLSNIQQSNSEFTNSVEHNYSNTSFGSQAISDAAQNISNLTYEIEQLKIQDTLSGYYNRIVDTNNAQKIAELQAQLAAEMYSLETLKNSYEREQRDFIRDIMANSEGTGLGSGDSSFWKIGYSWLFEPPRLDFGLGEFVEVAQDTKSFMLLNTTQDMSRWMAGGDLYDAPRAGDVTFSAIGNLNTVRFLGIEDKNKTDNMLLAHINPELNLMFGALAGDDGFSVI